MRLSLIFIMLILLPVATGAHAWLFCRENLPSLTQEALDRLREAGVRDPVVDVRFFDLAITGEAASPAAREKALAAIRALVPLRLLPGADRLHVMASLQARLEKDTLFLSGWLPEEEETSNVRQILAELRPDLRIEAEELRSAPEVRWPEGLKLPLTAGSPLLKPIVEKLRVPAELRISAKGESIVLSGLLPATEIKEEIVAALAEVAGARVVDPSALKASPHVMPADFAKPGPLAAFAREFFAQPPPRSFEIGTDGVPHLEGLATRQMESAWLTLLRPVTGAAKVNARLTLLPSAYHFPGYQSQTALPPEVLNPVREAVKTLQLEFETGSSRLTAEQQTSLAVLAPVLLAAGPALRLVIGAHPDPAGPVSVEKNIGLARAEAVLSFLVEQGVPAGDISAVVFDPVPAGPSATGIRPRSVEILVK